MFIYLFFMYLFTSDHSGSIHKQKTKKETHNNKTRKNKKKYIQLEMWANAQRDGRPAEYRWRPLFNAAKFG